MKNLDVRHYLGVYQTRKNMQDRGITNPREEIKRFTKEFVEKLSRMPLDEEVKLEGKSFYDSKGNIIAIIPELK